MGQFLDYLSSVFTKNKLQDDSNSNKDQQNHVTFADNSFTQAFTLGGKSAEDKAAKLASVSQANRRTIYFYQALGALAFILHLSLVTLPKVQLDSFDITEPAGWQLLTLNVVPLVVYFATISAMNEVNRPLSEGAKLSSKNSSGLDLNENDFIHSMKIVTILMALSQLSSIVSDQFIWSSVMIIPLWCYLLTNRVAHDEYKRYAPSPKKQWGAKLPGLISPLKQQQQSTVANSTPVKKAQTPRAAARNADAAIKATPRTRTRRAVKNMMDNVADKYHAFEQTVAHQVSQRIVAPLSPKMKMLEHG